MSDSPEKDAPERMDLLYLAHCAPFPADKGEKFRAHRESRLLARKHKVHLVCFARNPQEMQSTLAVGSEFASIHVELLSSKRALAGAAVRFAAGGCLNVDFFSSRSVRRHIEQLSKRVRFSAAVAYSLAMVQYVPAGVPYVLDMQDVDSEKWFQYSRLRWPGFLYAIEARRLRNREVDLARPAAGTLFTTCPEETLFRSFAGENLRTASMENGVLFDQFDPAVTPRLAELRGRRFLVFVGTMDYHPNADAVCWFAESVFPELRKRDPSLEFFIVGRNPTPEVARLGKIPNIIVTGAVANPGPYLADALALVAPMRIARGIQNKVLEAIAMSKWSLVSPEVCKCFGEELPWGIIPCATSADYCEALSRDLSTPDPGIREEGRKRFSWETNLQVFLDEVENAMRSRSIRKADLNGSASYRYGTNGVVP
jgi:sugar transferase (PEP-CTERM/EpsH1 system associated)